MERIFVTSYWNQFDNSTETVYVGTDEQKAFSFEPLQDWERKTVWVDVWEDGKLIESKCKRWGATEWA
jgi:hypothetical protein